MGAEDVPALFGLMITMGFEILGLVDGLFRAEPRFHRLKFLPRSSHSLNRLLQLLQRRLS